MLIYRLFLTLANLLIFIVHLPIAIISDIYETIIDVGGLFIRLLKLIWSVNSAVEFIDRAKKRDEEGE